MTRPSHLQLVTPDYRPPTPPLPVLCPPKPPAPAAPSWTEPAKIRLLPAMRSLAKVIDDPLAIETVLAWLEVKKVNGPLGRRDLRETWRTLATKAEKMGRPACLVYQGTTGRPLVRLPRWLARPHRPEPDPGALAASEALTLPAAGRVIRAAARDSRTLARLRWKQMIHPCPT